MRDSAVDQIGSSHGQARGPELRRRTWWLVGVLLALMVLSSVAHLWALHRFLPVPDVDEPTSVRPAVHIAATGDPNPHLFLWPGSTVIYPLAGLVHVWDVLGHHGPVLTSDPSLTARFHRSPSDFYVIGRLWTIALSVGALPLLFLVGRRAFNTQVALIGVAIWTVLPFPVQMARMARPDSAGVFFGLLALWLCLRLLDEPRTRWRVLAGVAVGLAVSSRYFMVALVPVLVAAAIKPWLRPSREAAGLFDSRPPPGSSMGEGDDVTPNVGDRIGQKGASSGDHDWCFETRSASPATSAGDGATTQRALRSGHLWPGFVIRPAIRAAGIAVASAIAGFALSTPYFFLDWHTAADSIRIQNRGPVNYPGSGGLSHIGNLRWYLGTAIPEGLTWPLLVLAAAGVVLMLARPQARQLLLVAFCAIFLAGISASHWHLIHWMIQVLPVLVVFAASTVAIIIRHLTAAMPRVLRTRVLVPVALTGITAVLAFHPLTELLDANRYDNASPSTSGATRTTARNWMVTHIRPGSRVLVDSDTLPLHRMRVDVDYRFNPRAHTLADYQRAGYQYLVVNTLHAGLYRFDAVRHPREAAFYQDVACHTRLIESFPHGAPQLHLRDGWAIRIYRLHARPRKTIGLFCAQRAGD